MLGWQPAMQSYASALRQLGARVYCWIPSFLVLDRQDDERRKVFLGLRNLLLFSPGRAILGGGGGGVRTHGLYRQAVIGRAQPHSGAAGPGRCQPDGRRVQLLHHHRLFLALGHHGQCGRLHAAGWHHQRCARSASAVLTGLPVGQHGSIVGGGPASHLLQSSGCMQFILLWRARHCGRLHALCYRRHGSPAADALGLVRCRGACFFLPVPCCFPASYCWHLRRGWQCAQGWP